MPHFPDVVDHRSAAAAAPTAPPVRGTRHVAWLAAAALPGVAVVPALAVAGKPVEASPFQCVIAGVIALVCFLAAASVARGALLCVLGVFSASVAAWLLAQASYPVAAWLVAPALGAGAGAVFGDTWQRGAERLPRRRGGATVVALALLLAGVLVLLRTFAGRDTAMGVAAACVAGVAAVRMLAAPGHARAAVVAPLAALLVLIPSGTAAYIGATTPRVTWFGALTSHGPRSGNEVAVTFDDGPNPPYTLQIAAILDQHGAKGTFFTVGKALEARPDVSKALMEDGQLLGNHSYRHDAVRWLDPRYPELRKTQDAFRRNLGVCPAFYRPPHGSHTPFMAHVVADHGMTMVTWDDSAGDWATSDGNLVAQRILKEVKPGSIILLHDGIDGNIGADRNVILQALPIILDGLKARGLQPVTLDKLLGKPGYVPC